MFGKKKFSTSRFVERAVELDTFHLFTHMPLTAAISKVSTTSTLPHKDQRTAYAAGVIHDSYGDGRPLLPVEIEFEFKSSGEGAGWGEVWNNALGEERGAYRARVYVFDPGAHFFKAVELAAEHAAMSGDQFLHLSFHRKRKKPYDAKTDHRESKLEQERLDALMRRIDAGDENAEMPAVEFDTVSIDDAIRMRAPIWSHAWVDDVLDRVMYHSRDAAKWRSQPWRQ